MPEQATWWLGGQKPLLVKTLSSCALPPRDSGIACIAHQRPTDRPRPFPFLAVIAIRFREEVGGNQTTNRRPTPPPPLPFPLPFPPPLPLLFPFATEFWTTVTVTVLVAAGWVTVEVTTIVVVTVTTCAAVSRILDWLAKFQFGFSCAPITKKNKSGTEMLFISHTRSSRTLLARSLRRLVWPWCFLCSGFSQSTKGYVCLYDMSEEKIVEVSDVGGIRLKNVSLLVRYTQTDRQACCYSSR